MIVCDVMWRCSLNLHTLHSMKSVPSSSSHSQCRKQNSVTTWTHVELQALGPLSDHTVARPAHVVPLVLKQVVASRGVAVTVERHWSTGTSCGGQRHLINESINHGKQIGFLCCSYPNCFTQTVMAARRHAGHSLSVKFTSRFSMESKHPIIFRRNSLNISVSCESVSSSLHTHTWCLKRDV